jgi:hypothetical protein
MPGARLRSIDEQLLGIVSSWSLALAGGCRHQATDAPGRRAAPQQRAAYRVSPKHVLSVSDHCLLGMTSPRQKLAVRRANLPRDPRSLADGLRLGALQSLPHSRRISCPEPASPGGARKFVSDVGEGYFADC